MYHDHMDSAFGSVVESIVYKGYEIEVRKLDPDSEYVGISDMVPGQLTYHCESTGDIETSLTEIQNRIDESLLDQAECEARLAEHG